MFRTLWKQSLGDSWRLLCGCAVVVFAICLLLVWGTSLVQASQWQQMITDLMPEFVQKMFPVPLAFVASPAGRLAAGYEHPFLIVVMGLWAITRGADAISGRLADGTLEMVLAQPVGRLVALLAHATVTLVGCVVIGAFAWIGTAFGVAIIRLEEPVTVWPFLAAAGNLCTVGIFLAGLTSLFGSWNSARGRSVGLAVGFCAVEAILEIVARQAPQYPWLSKATFFSAYQPQRLVYQLLTDGEAPWESLFDCYGILIVLGLVAFAASAVIFGGRDLPAPL